MTKTGRGHFQDSLAATGERIWMWQFRMWMKRDFSRYGKFLIVGTSNAAVDLLVLNAFVLLLPTTSSLLLFIYNTVAVACAIANSYIWNRRWTFADSARGGQRERMLFWLQGLFNMAVNDAVVVGMSRYLVLTHDLPLIVGGNLAKGLAMFISSSISYVFMRVFVFADRVWERSKGP